MTVNQFLLTGICHSLEDLIILNFALSLVMSSTPSGCCIFATEVTERLSEIQRSAPLQVSSNSTSGVPSTSGQQPIRSQDRFRRQSGSIS